MKINNNINMSKGLIFFCCSCAILLFTIINLSVGPIIHGKVNNDWGTANCEYLKDKYDKSPQKDDVLKYGDEWAKDECIRKKAMHDMEYTSFIFNAVIGYVCATLGLLHLFDVKKEFVSKTGLIGLGCGIVGFVFSFVYVILNGLVYTTYYDDSNLYKRDSDGVFAEKKGNDYECIYFDSEHNTHALIAKYSDLIQKQYNYDKDLIESLAKINGACKTTYSPSDCGSDGKISPTIPNCDKLYIDDYSSGSSTFEVTNKDLSDRFLTTLLLSLFVCLANIGLAIFGFLLFRTPGEF